MNKISVIRAPHQHSL